MTAISIRNTPSVSTDRPGTGSDRIWVSSFANTDRNTSSRESVLPPGSLAQGLVCLHAPSSMRETMFVTTVMILFPMEGVSPALNRSDLPVHRDFALDVMCKGVNLAGDAVVEQIIVIPGLARYCNDGGPMNNVVFTMKVHGRLIFYGIKVRPGVLLLPGYEIFVSHGWKTNNNSI